MSSLTHLYPLLLTKDPYVSGEQPELFQAVQKEQKPFHFQMAGPSAKRLQ